MGPTSLAVDPRSMMTSPSGTGALARLPGGHLGRLELFDVAPATARRLALGAAGPAGPSARAVHHGPGPAGAPAPGPPVRVRRIRSRPVPPGREGPPVRGAPVVGRAPIGRGPPALARGSWTGHRADARPGAAGLAGRRRLRGRPGGGGIGRPVELSGGRVGVPRFAAFAGLGAAWDEWSSGPAGDTSLRGTGLRSGARLRTTFGPAARGARMVLALTSAGLLDAGALACGRGRRFGACARASTEDFAAALAAFAAFAALAASAGRDLATQALGVGATTDAVGLGVLDRRRGARGADAQFLGEREQLLARYPELFGELVYSDLLLRQNVPLIVCSHVPASTILYSSTTRAHLLERLPSARSAAMSSRSPALRSARAA